MIDHRVGRYSRIWASDSHLLYGDYSGLNLNRYGVASPCRTGLNLIHYIYNFDTICFSSKEKIYAGTAADTYSFFSFYFIRL
ncbi:hypothetical protein, partial [Neisseria gonorrhoeae]